MTNSKRSQALENILNRRISAIIRTKEAGLARDAMQAAVDGGFRIAEFTLTTPDALTLITELAARSDLIVGAGTVLTREQARQAVGAGARFLVSPIADPEIINQAHELDVPCIPGAFTPTEMETAHRAGADLVKVFPEPYGGPDFITAVLAPLPHLRLFPTGGVSADNVTRFLDAGCAGCGFVRTLFTPDDMRTRDFKSIRERASLIVQTVDDWVAKNNLRRLS